MSSAGLLGRSAEQATLRRMLASLSDGMSATLVLRGEPGIGKTALLEDAIAVADGLQVARLQGIQPEMGFGYARLHRLLFPFLGKLSGLPKQQGRVLGAARGIRGPLPARFCWVWLC